MVARVTAPAEEIPRTWAEVAQNWGVTANTVTRAARSSLIAKGVELDGYIPGPRAVVPEIFEAVRKIVLSRSSARGSTIQGVQKLTKIETQRKIRECLDKHEKLLGEDIIETVADELGLPLSDVREVLKQRWEARKLERKILAEMQEEAATLQKAQAARDAETARRAAEEAERTRPRPLLPTRPEPPQASASSAAAAPEKDPRAERPTGFPQRGENVGFDDALRAAWIAIRAGLPKVAEQTLPAVQEVYPDATLEDVIAGIEAAYWERPEGARKTMERRAERLKGESNA